MPPRTESLPLNASERLLLRVLRYIGASYETGDAACWDAAHDAAEAVEGVIEGPLLVARATVFFRLLRRARHEINIMPPSSRWLSDDEGRLMTLVRHAKDAKAFDWADSVFRSFASTEHVLVAAGFLIEEPSPRPDLFNAAPAFVRARGKHCEQGRTRKTAE